MYLDHFGLNQAPFRITPHTDFFFSGANRGATLEALLYAVTHDEGIVKVSGEVGSGKTMLCRMLLQRLPSHVETVYLANPLLSRDEIPFAIAEELRLAPASENGHLLLRSLRERLLELYAAGRQVVVLIDEAHAMPAESLETVRLLSNLESSQHKLLQLVLFGQPELDQRLAEPAMRQLRDRITHHFQLDPLPRDDVGVYLMFRLRAAGYRGPDLFTPAAIRLLSRASGGLTRRINVLADKALLAAFASGVHQVDRSQVAAAIRDSRLEPIAQHGRWGWPTAAACGVVALGALAYVAWHTGSGMRERDAAGAAAANSPAAAHSAAPGALSANARPLLAASAADETPFPLAERMAETEGWLQRVPRHHHVIQLLVSDRGSERQITAFLANNAKTLDLRQVRVYRTRVGGRERLGILYGEYASHAEASAALTGLGAITPASRPYVRPVASLR